MNRLLLKVLAIAACGLAAGCDGRSGEAARAPVTPRPAVSPERSSGAEALPVVDRAARLRRYPESCPGPRPAYVQSAPARWIGKTVGADPLFAGFYGFSPAHRAVRENAPRRHWGYRIKTLWVMRPDNEQVVVVRAHHVETREPVWLEVEDDPRVVARFDPEDPGHSIEPEARGWKSWGSYLYFPRAGCYRFVARWSGGSWRLTVGFGARR